MAMICTSRIDSKRREGRELLTESAPGWGDSGGADKVGGVVEAAEDAGGDVGADPLQEVHDAAHLRHGAPRLPFFLGLGPRGGGGETREKCESANDQEPF